ncbi:MAG: hypothetical protein J6U53_04350, partial [Tidjanibacter sp.]|nr:hypothetical protein [Tidjanibacter sp.]
MRRFSVADHIFELAMGAMCRPVPCPHNFRPFVTTEEGEPLFRVVLDADVEVRTDEPLQRFDYDLQAGDCTLAIYPEEYRLTIRSVGEMTIVCPFAEEGEVAEYRANLFGEGKAPNSVMFDHALCFAYSFATLPHKTLLIHSSVIVKEGRSVMCLGESGTGKSTHTRLWLENIDGTERLNDDGPVVRVMADGEVRVFGSPWSGKGAVYRAESTPIAGFLRLSQAPENRIQKLGRIGAFSALLPSTLPTLQKEERTLDLICGALSEMIIAVPAYTLACLPDAAAARLSYETIFAALG